MNADVQVKRAVLRHAVATLAYRGGKTLMGTPQDFSTFRIAATSRTPAEILAHIGDLLDWALSLAKGTPVWHDSHPLEWDLEVARFFAGLHRFDDYLASDLPLGNDVERLFQGPIADALTHVGQLAMLRRAAGSPVHGENFFNADIAAGRIGPDQTKPRVEFD